MHSPTGTVNIASEGTQHYRVDEIAARFPDLVRVLAEISFETLFRDEVQLVRVYTRWLRARGRQDAEWRLRRGIVAVDPAVKSRH